MAFPGEAPAERARIFVQNVSEFFHNRFDFHVEENCYEGGDRAAAVVLDNGDVIRFDILMSKRPTVQRPAQHFFCECKWRQNGDDLRQELREFVLKARKAASYAESRYGNNFSFLFVTNKAFGVSNTQLGDLDFLKNLMDGDLTTNELNMLADKVRTVMLDDWLLEMTLGGQ